MSEMPESSSAPRDTQNRQQRPVSAISRDRLEHRRDFPHLATWLKMLRYQWITHRRFLPFFSFLPGIQGPDFPRASILLFNRAGGFFRPDRKLDRPPRPRTNVPTSTIVRITNPRMFVPGMPLAANGDARDILIENDTGRTSSEGTR